MENKEINPSIKNKIVTISGEPVSGKSTVINTMTDQLQEMGYTEDQIHLVGTGKQFRSYFNQIISFIRNIEQDKIWKELAKTKEIKDILQNEEYKKILIDTIIATKKIDLRKFTINDANKNVYFSGLRRVVDELIDKNIEHLGKQINQEQHPNDIWIIDSRLAFHNIPSSFAVRLTTNANVAANRLFHDKNRGKEDSQYLNLEEAKREREERRIGERNRYVQRYGINLEDVNNYNLIIDTSYSPVEDIADIILEGLKSYEQNDTFPKMWASPKQFIPLQSEIQTYSGKVLDDGSLEQLTEKIIEQGYDPSEAIEIIEVDGYPYILEGHHRNFATIRAGKTLIPYQIVAKDDEKIEGYGNNTARQRAKSLTFRNLMGHEAILEEGLKKYDKNAKFKYADIYPEIVEKVRQEVETER